jgi:hypothetical protein
VAGRELLARFVEHVLPPGFVKIRHYGLHAASHATTRLEVARGRLTSSAVPRDRGARGSEPLDWRKLLLRVSGFDARVCPPVLADRRGAHRAPGRAQSCASGGPVIGVLARSTHLRSPARSQRGTSVPATRAPPVQRPPRPHEGSAERPQRTKRPRRTSPAQPLLRVASARLRTAPKQLPHSLH